MKISLVDKIKTGLYGQSRLNTLHLNWPQLKAFLEDSDIDMELVYITGQCSNFPIDDYKCDINLVIKDERTGLMIDIWNFKNGPNYLPEYYNTIDEIEEFSVGYIYDRTDKDKFISIPNEIRVQYSSIVEQIEAAAMKVWDKRDVKI